MTHWHVAYQQKLFPPLGDADMREAVAQGRFPSGCLVWRKGMPGWEPIEAHFSLPGDTPPPMPGSVPPPMPDFSAPPPVPGMPAAKGPVMGLVLHAMLTIGLVVTFMLQHFMSAQLPEILDNETAWSVALVAAIIAGVSLVWRSWRSGVRQLNASGGKSGGGFKVAAVLTAMAMLAFSVLFVSQFGLMHRVGHARQAYDKFTMDVDVASGVITVEGMIGPSFVRKLRDALNTHSGLNTLVISSPGGLVDQALEAAELIEKHHVAVLAHKECSSACLVVLMAGEKRLADWDLRLGFHGSSLITQVDGAQVPLQGLSEEADSYLKRRGVPEDVLAHGFTSGLAQLEMVPAIRLMESGSLTALMDGWQQVPLEEAKWRMVEQDISVSDQQTSRFAGVMTAIRDVSPDTMRQFAPSLYEAYLKRDVEGLAAAIHAIVSSLVPAALEAADADALHAYMSSTNGQLEYLAQLEDWKSCASYVDGGVGAEAMNILSHSLLAQEFAALEGLIRSAAAREWTRQPIPAWAEERASAYATDALVAMNGEQLGVDAYRTDPKIRCVYTHVLLSNVLREGPQTAAPVLRWLSRQGAQERKE